MRPSWSPIRTKSRLGASDPDDGYLIAVARREDADALVSGDRALRAIEGLELLVLTPAEALSRLSGSD
jgi:predicted nucleic acid-binding protein